MDIHDQRIADLEGERKHNWFMTDAEIDALIAKERSKQRRKARLKAKKGGE